MYHLRLKGDHYAMGVKRGKIFNSWMLCMGCCMYNLENNVPVEIRGCTAFAYSKGGRIIYGRMAVVKCTPSVKNIREAEKYDKDSHSGTGCVN